MHLGLSFYWAKELTCVHLPAGLLRLKGTYDPTADLEEMKREKDEADREARVSIFSLVKGGVLGPSLLLLPFLI